MKIPLAPGDRLFVYTDGITEAPSPEGEVFGYARLKNVLYANTKAPLSELKSAVLRAVHQHTKKAITIILYKLNIPIPGMVIALTVVSVRTTPSHNSKNEKSLCHLRINGHKG